MNPAVLINVAVWAFILVMMGITRATNRKKTAKKHSGRATPFTATQMKEDTRSMPGKQHGGVHTHDRLDFDCYKPDESEYEHYKKQLDVLKNAGLMEKSEYDEMLRRFSTERI